MRPLAAPDAFATAYRSESCAWLGLDQRSPERAWTGSADAGDRAVVAQCVGPTLDVGCGPGRLTELLAADGRVVLGIDPVPEAVRQTRRRGAAALLRDVFDRVPAEGRWATALLADGNIGIGGDPVGLLRRLRQLLAADGRVVVDLAAPGVGLRLGTVRLRAAWLTSEPFPWAAVGADVVAAVGREAGLPGCTLHRHGDRWFGVLRAGW